jgi:hypothetical protein
VQCDVRAGCDFHRRNRLSDVLRRTIVLRHSDADGGASKRTCSLRLACSRKTCQVLSLTGYITRCRPDSARASAAAM